MRPVLVKLPARSGLLAEHRHAMIRFPPVDLIDNPRRRPGERLLRLASVHLPSAEQSADRLARTAVPTEHDRARQHVAAEIDDERSAFDPTDEKAPAATCSNITSQIWIHDRDDPKIGASLHRPGLGHGHASDVSSIFH